MKRKKTTDRSRRTSAQKEEQQFCGPNGRLVGLMTYQERCEAEATTKVEYQLIQLSPANAKRILPCISDDELRAALNEKLAKPKVRVTVAGGIVRHGIC